MRRILCVLLAAVLFLGYAPVVFAQDILPQQSHLAMTWEALEALEYDQTAFEALGQEILALTEDKENFGIVEEKLRSLREMYLILDTKLEVSSIDSYRDVTDPKASDEYLNYLDFHYAADEVLGEVVPAVLSSPCEEALDRQDSVFSYYLWGTTGYSQEHMDLYYEEEALVDQYYADLNQDFSVEYQGKTYTQASADEAYISMELSYEAYDEIMLQLAMAQNNALADYYIALVENRRLHAESYGYKDTASFYDECYYYRELSEREREELYDAVKDQIVPILSALEERIYAAYEEAGYQECVYSSEELLSTLRMGLELVSTELLPAVDYMTEFGYYDIAYGENKVEGAFTTLLSYPNAPYLMMNPTGTSYDFTTIVHEFGHYNAFFCSPDPMAYNLDLAEVHSQGLELLMLKHYEMIFGQQAEIEKLNTIYAIVMSLVDGCMFDELERYAYETEDLTVEDMNKKYMELLKEYGYREMEDEAEEAYGWVITSHLYGYPVYYLSYAASAAAALGIWENSLTDYDGAVEDYLALVALGESGTFYGNLEEIGLEDPLSYETIFHLADALEDGCGLAAREVISPEFEEENMNQVLIVLGVIVIIWFIVTVLVMCWAVKKEKKRHAEYRQYLYQRAALAAEEGPGSYGGGGSTTAAAGGEAWGRESGEADDLPAAGESTVPEPAEDETPGSEC